MKIIEDCFSFGIKNNVDFEFYCALLLDWEKKGILPVCMASLN